MVVKLLLLYEFRCNILSRRLYHYHRLEGITQLVRLLCILVCKFQKNSCVNSVLPQQPCLINLGKSWKKKCLLYHPCWCCGWLACSTRPCGRPCWTARRTRRAYWASGCRWPCRWSGRSDRSTSCSSLCSGWCRTWSQAEAEEGRSNDQKMAKNKKVDGPQR